MLGGLFWLVGDHRVAGFDRGAFDVLAAARGSLLARLAKPAAVIGPVLLVITVLIVIAVLVRHRAWRDATVVVAGFVLSAVGVSLAKAAERRPRPSGSLLDAGGFSFPSSISAVCVGLAAIAIALAHLTSNRTSRAVVIAAGCLLTVTAGLLFVALRVHYLTDVIAGWALGVVTFAACGLAAHVAAIQRA